MVADFVEVATTHYEEEEDVQEEEEDVDNPVDPIPTVEKIPRSKSRVVVDWSKNILAFVTFGKHDSHKIECI